MITRTDEIADGIFRFSTYVPDGPPGGITFNQFLLTGDEPMLFHTGMRFMFGSVIDAVARVTDPAALRHVGSCHASRPDEYGALRELEAVAPSVTVAHGGTGVFLCLTDMADRPPRALADDEVVDLGGKRMRWIATPHVPGPWEAGVMFEETTGTLFVGDLFARTGDCDPLVSDDIVDAAIAHDQLMHGHAYTPQMGATLRTLAGLGPQRLALMHGPAFDGDTSDALVRLADYFDAELSAQCALAG